LTPAGRKVVLIRLGIYLFVNKARGGGSPKFLFILSRLYETKIPQLRI